VFSTSLASSWCGDVFVVCAEGRSFGVCIGSCPSLRFGRSPTIPCVAWRVLDWCVEPLVVERTSTPLQFIPTSVAGCSPRHRPLRTTTEGRPRKEDLQKGRVKHVCRFPGALHNTSSRGLHVSNAPTKVLCEAPNQRWEVCKNCCHWGAAREQKTGPKPSVAPWQCWRTQELCRENDMSSDQTALAEQSLTKVTRGGMRTAAA